jgi:pilus assembly protein CpaC
VVLSGFTIPALSTRKTETDVELGEGQSFAIAGLIDERVQNQLSKIPGLANIPILGALFKSNNKQKSKTELVDHAVSQERAEARGEDAGA